MDSPPKVNENGINDLPSNLLIEIFKYLSLIDRVKLRPICKLWNELLPKVKTERLSVDPFLYYKERWYHSNRPCRESELCDPDLFVVQFKKSALMGLKYLKLNYRLTNDHNKLKDFDLSQLNAFTQLIQLDIDYYQAADLQLNLSNLQIFALRWHKNCRLYLNTPKLEALRYNEPADSDLLSVERPESIRVLDTAMFGAKLARFPNLERLRYMHYDPRSIDSATLLALDQLKEVYYDFRITHFEHGSFDKMKKALQEFMRQKRALGRTVLKVYFVGLQLIADDLSDIEFGLETRKKGSFMPIEKLYMRHYDRLQDEMRFVWQVNYSRLFASVDVLPTDYFTRFFNLSRVSASCPLNEAHFLDFLRKIYRLEWLKVYDCDLSQEFFNTLPEFKSLTRLVMIKTETRKDREGYEINLNFAFVGQFHEMRVLTIHEDLSLLSLQSFLPALQNLKRMNPKCQFWFKGIYFEVKGKATSSDEGKVVSLDEKKVKEVSSKAEYEETEDSSDEEEADREPADKYVLLTDNCRVILKSATLDEIVKYFERLTSLAGPD